MSSGRLTTDSDIVDGLVRTIIRLPEAHAEALERTARRRGISKAAVIREALAALFERESDGSAVERALRGAGTGASGVSDLGERHDEYLADRSHS